MTRAYQLDAHFQNGLVWFRRDLRTGDNAALYYALKHCERVWCVFVFDTTILQPLIDWAHERDGHKGKVQDRRVEFILASLEELRMKRFPGLPRNSKPKPFSPITTTSPLQSSAMRQSPNG
jgi:hypothetical protein